jgi:plastocyanin
MRRAVWRWAGALAIASILVGAAASAVTAADKTIHVGDFAYPSSTTVRVGDTVTWSNTSGAAHTVTADGGSFDKSLPDGGNASVTFTTAGSFAYHCTIHSSMTGRILVTSGAPATDTADPAPADHTDHVSLILGLLGIVMLTATWLAGRRFGSGRPGDEAR